MQHVPQRVTGVKGENISINCSASLFMPNAMLDVYWWKKGQRSTFSMTREKTKIAMPFHQGSSEFRLINVSFQDSGVYYCGVKKGPGMMSNGTGTEVTIYVPPTPITITRLSSPFLKLLCTTASFFPEEFNLTWYENDRKITSGINTTKFQEKEGLHQVSSSLYPVEIGLVYTCQVSHVSLVDPANDSYLVSDQGKKGNGFSYALAFSWIAGGFIILVLAIVVRLYKLERSHGDAVAEEIDSRVEEQVIHKGKVEGPTYADLHFNEHRKMWKPRSEKEAVVYTNINYHSVQDQL
ncbi:tapasin-related protein-like isoform X2 [Chiloscyllium plagiosum]|uniref:tapasin-related protein-like isoform X2 n=1 Tax=Chiloscyllium plagiosum TaxID=36176 RepID=UPI001CB86E12|nr:tapasin-related protein-like isoform X2 [Chiloscyllium plagiosum]